MLSIRLSGFQNSPLHKNSLGFNGNWDYPQTRRPLTFH